MIDQADFSWAVIDTKTLVHKTVSNGTGLQIIILLGQTNVWPSQKLVGQK
jgi:hypothetical protein